MKMRTLASLALLSLSLFLAPAAGAVEHDADTKAAITLLRSARANVRNGRVDAARADLAKIEAQYSHTKTAPHARQFGKEVDLLGTDAGELAIEKWYVGSAKMNDGDFTVLVFWETWCPYCKREIPKLEALHQRFKDNGLNLIGLTRVTKSSSDARVEAFIDKHAISYPTGKDAKGEMTKRFAVKGVPSAVAIKNGKVAWIGHPSVLQDAFVEQWIIAGSE